jgi:homoserine kinase type II
MAPYVASPKTQLGAEELRAILRHYSLSLRDFAAIPQGTINSNYRVITDEGPLFLRVCEGKSLADATFETSLIWHLGSRGLRTPALWRTRYGSAFVPFRPGKPVMLFSWVAGRQHADAEIDAAHAFHIGELLAELHLSAADVRREHAGIYTLRHINERLGHLRADAIAQAELGPILASLQGEAELLSRLRQRDLPRGIGHNDLFPDNLLFSRCLPRYRPGATRRTSPSSGWVLDLEQAATLPYVYDLAVALLACCAPVPTLVPHTGTPQPDEGAEATAAGANTAGEDPSRIGPLQADTARALITGYQSLRALSPAEWHGLYPELRFAALRFTVTRLTDVHGYGTATPRPHVEGKDFREFLFRLHRLIATDREQLCAHLRQPF